MWTSRGILLTVAGAGTFVLGACSRSGHVATPRPADSVQIGYGTQPKSKVTGAVTTLSDKDLGARPLDIEDLLRGKVAGLEVIRVGNSIRLRIRGTGSMLADQEPLVIVDDVRIQEGNVLNALAGLTRDDIKQVNVLKDVASTSIYGLRGAGGVIVITTKTKDRPPEQQDRS